MTAIPGRVSDADAIAKMEAAGLTLISQGKVREMYELPDYPGLLLQVASDRLSIFDIVLSVLVPDKGAVLTALTIFWLKEVLKDIPNHLIAYGGEIDAYLPEALHSNPELQKRALIVKKIEILPIECIVRGYLTGSGWRDYCNQGGMVCGHQLPKGLHDGSMLPKPLFTPSTKAEAGHDQNIDYELAGKELQKASLTVYNKAVQYAQKKCIIIADTKFEFGRDSDGALILGDEVLTPDSSRFWDSSEWIIAAADRKAPSGFDKEPVRQWGRNVETTFGFSGIGKLDNANPDHMAFIASLDIPRQVVAATTGRYLEILKRLTV